MVSVLLVLICLKYCIFGHFHDIFAIFHSTVLGLPEQTYIPQCEVKMIRLAPHLLRGRYTANDSGALFVNSGLGHLNVSLIIKYQAITFMFVYSIINQYKWITNLPKQQPKGSTKNSTTQEVHSKITNFPPLCNKHTNTYKYVLSYLY